MTDAVTFVLNGAPMRLHGVTPSTTLYQILRARGLTGTKEGCAEGDCGACTVAIGDLDGCTLKLRAVNACILLAGNLHGRVVTTVEAVSGPGGALHPCQQAMVDAHGSQCGFCTPGFVMTLYVAHAMDQLTNHASGITDLLAGNLCRCTGYGPIMAAARAMKAAPEPAWTAARRRAELAALASFDGAGSLQFRHGGQQLFLPATTDELAAILMAHPEATIVAGATDVGLWITKQFRDLSCLVHIGRITELQRMTRDRATLRIGATVTLTAAHAMLVDLWPGLGELLRRFGSPLIRNAATVGGNIANGSPISDLAPALIALGAAVVLRRGDSRRQVDLADFFLAYGRQDRQSAEFVEAIEVPLDTGPDELTCYKISKRIDQDISAVSASFNLRIADGQITRARIAYGGMAGIPKRARFVEAAMVGRPWSLASIEAAVSAFDDEFTPMSDQRASAEYRMLVAKNLLRRVYHERQASPPETRA